MRQTFSLSCDQMDTFEAVLENLIMSPQSLNIVIVIYHCQTSVVIITLIYCLMGVHVI